MLFRSQGDQDPSGRLAASFTCSQRSWLVPYAVSRTLGLCAFVAFLPAIVLVAVVILIVDGRPVFFRQQRAGLHGVPFGIFKYRTMREPRPGEDRMTSDDVRITRIGRVIRRLSLDELPQLVNVMRGEMLLVGPRPLHVSYNDRYSETQRRRLEVFPGITGWAQVNGRNGLSWDDRFQLDVWYVDNRSTALDLQILRLTLSSLTNTDVGSAQSATMHEFLGER